MRFLEINGKFLIGVCSNHGEEFFANFKQIKTLNSLKNMEGHFK